MNGKIWVTVLGMPALIALSGTAWIYAVSELHLRSFPEPPAFTAAITQDAANIERGEHLARTRGCFGCHGPQLSGEEMWGFAVAPNLPALARSESASALDAAIRYGIGRDGRALYSMPSYNFMRLRDEDVADIIAYLRSQPVVEKVLPRARLPWPIRWDIAHGRDDAIAAFLDLVPELKGDALGDSALARGEYIAMTTCNECHGFSLRADTPWDDGSAPDLIIIAAYDEAAFRTLMTTGIALGDRELDMMSRVARSRFAYFTEQEISDLYAFLSDMATRAIAR